MSSAFASAPRACIFSHWSADGEVAAYVRLHLEAIRSAGYVIAFASSGPLTPQAAASLEGLCALVTTRENVGYDFGAWRHVLQRTGELEADRLLLVNDSVYGPFASLPAFLDRLTATPADMWGAIESDAYGRHLQSWFLVLSPAARFSTTFRKMMHDPLDAKASKWALVQRYEIGLSQGLLEEGLRLHAAFRLDPQSAIANAHPFNPCGILWRRLVEGPAPYIKTSVLRSNPTLSAGIGGWRRVAERLAPEAAAAAAQDLSARGARPPTGLWNRWRASLTPREPARLARGSGGAPRRRVGASHRARRRDQPSRVRAGARGRRGGPPGAGAWARPAHDLTTLDAVRRPPGRSPFRSRGCSGAKAGATARIWPSTRRRVPGTGGVRRGSAAADR